MRDERPKRVKEDMLEYLDSRFGIKREMLGDHELYLASKGRVYLGPKSIPPNMRIVTLGLLVARIGATVKPTTNLLQAFGRLIAKNRIELSREQTVAYAKGADIELGPDQMAGASDGYVLLVHRDQPLGCGLLRGDSIRNMLPKAKRLELKFI